MLTRFFENKIGYYTVAGCVPAAIFHISTLGEIIEVSHGAVQLTGFSPEELRNISIFSLFFGPAVFMEDELLNHTFLNIQGMDAIMLTKTGTHEEVKISLAGVFENQEIVGYQLLAGPRT